MSMFVENHKLVCTETMQATIRDVRKVDLEIPGGLCVN